MIIAFIVLSTNWWLGGTCKKTWVAAILRGPSRGPKITHRKFRRVQILECAKFEYVFNKHVQELYDRGIKRTFMDAMLSHIVPIFSFAILLNFPSEPSQHGVSSYQSNIYKCRNKMLLLSLLVGRAIKIHLCAFFRSAFSKWNLMAFLTWWSWIN